MELLQPGNPVDSNVPNPSQTLPPLTVVPTPPVPPSTPQTPSPPAPRRSFWRIVLIIVVLFLLALGATVVLAWKTDYLDNYLPSSVKEWLGKSSETSGQATTVDTSSWKTFENSAYGISFKYPETYEIVESENLGSANGLFRIEDKQRAGAPTLVLFFNSNGSGQACIHDFYYDLSTEGEKIVIDNVGDSSGMNPEDCDQETNNVLAINFSVTGDYGNTIEGSFWFDRSGPSYKPEFEEIIGTFKVDRSNFENLEVPKDPAGVVQLCLRSPQKNCPETTSLSDLIERAESAQGGLWYDPILRAQDYDDTATAELIWSLGTAALVEGTHFETIKLHFSMKIEAGEWKIDDVYCPDKPETGIVAIWTKDLKDGIPPCE